VIDKFCPDEQNYGSLKTKQLYCGLKSIILTIAEKLASHSFSVFQLSGLLICVIKIWMQIVQNNLIYFLYVNMNRRKTVICDLKSRGQLYYDFDSDDIVFQNAKGDRTTLVKKNESNCLYKGIWNCEQVYRMNDMVKHDGVLFICKSKITKQDIWNIDNWEPLLGSNENEYICEEGIDNEVPLLCCCLVSNPCCYRYSEISCTSFRVDCSCDSNLDQPLEIFVKGNQIELPLKMITKSNPKYYDNIGIIYSGYYRITYNVVFCGSVLGFTSMVCKNGDEIILFSINRVQSVGNEINYVNKSFISPIRVRDDRTIFLSLCLKFTDHDGVKLSIYPVETYMNIEWIANL